MKKRAMDITLRREPVVMTQSQVDVWCWRRVFPGREHEVRAVRQWIAGLLPDCSSRDDVVTVAVELVTNALKFTASGRGGNRG